MRWWWFRGLYLHVPIHLISLFLIFLNIFPIIVFLHQINKLPFFLIQLLILMFSYALLLSMVVQLMRLKHKNVLIFILLITIIYEVKESVTVVKILKYF